MADDLYTRIGEAFGDAVADLVGTARERTVTIKEIDEDNNNAYVYIFQEEDEALPVPLSFMHISEGMLRVFPNVGSLASIVFINGDENTPMFTGFSQIDRIEISRGKTTLSWKITPPERDPETGDEPEDAETEDELTLTMGTSVVNVTNEAINVTGDDINLTAGASTIHMVDDVIEMNGGGLNGLVIVGKLTERLNKLQSEIDQIQANIASHSHTYIDSVGQAATPVPKDTTATTYTNVALTNVTDDDYVNKKITQ